MSERPAETIQTLLEAEEAAKSVIDSARRDRDARLRQATVEADREINAYRDRREAEYQAQLDALKGDAGNVSDQIARDAENAVKETLEASKKNKQKVLF